MTFKEMRNIFGLCKEYNVRSFKIPDLEVTFEEETTAVPLTGLPGMGRMPTEQEFLTMAVEGFDPNSPPPGSKEEG